MPDMQCGTTLSAELVKICLFKGVLCRTEYPHRALIAPCYTCSKNEPLPFATLVDQIAGPGPEKCDFNRNMNGNSWGGHSARLSKFLYCTEARKP